MDQKLAETRPDQLRGSGEGWARAPDYESITSWSRWPKKAEEGPFFLWGPSNPKRGKTKASTEFLRRSLRMASLIKSNGVRSGNVAEPVSQHLARRRAAPAPLGYNYNGYVMMNYHYARAVQQSSTSMNGCARTVRILAGSCMCVAYLFGSVGRLAV